MLYPLANPVSLSAADFVNGLRRRFCNETGEGYLETTHHPPYDRVTGSIFIKCIPDHNPIFFLPSSYLHYRKIDAF